MKFSTSLFLLSLGLGAASALPQNPTTSQSPSTDTILFDQITLADAI
jgi:hypothetical protein